MRVPAVRWALALALLLPLAACAEQGAAGGGSATSPARPTSEPAAASGLVLRAEYTGGFLPPPLVVGRVPAVSVYADGLVITEGPVPEIHPGPAWPDLQVTRIDDGVVQELVDRALAAGVAGTSDLGMPAITDVPSTRFTAVTEDRTLVREVYALAEGAQPDVSGLTGEQMRARAELRELVTTLVDAGSSGGSPESYPPDVVAAFLSPWVDPGDELRQDERPWPGPVIPVESTGGPLELRCVAASGEEAERVEKAARSADATTPWTTPDGTRWNAVFRPLLPDETGCADLTG
jgi:hypothetical protein